MRRFAPEGSAPGDQGAPTALVDTVTWRECFDSLDQGVLVQSAAGIVVEGNQVAFALLDRTRAEVIGHAAGELFQGTLHLTGAPLRGLPAPPDSPDRQQGDHRELVVGFASARGRPRWVSVHHHPITLADGSRGVVTNLVDVTEPGNLGAPRRDAPLAPGHLGEVLVHIDLDFSVQWISAPAAEQMGWRPTEVIGRTLFEFTHVEDAEVVRAAGAGVFAGREVDCVVRYQNASGAYRWIAIEARPVCDQRGVACGAVLLGHDVHDAVLAQEALNELNQRFAVAMATAPIGMAVVDLSDHFVEVNPKLCEMVGRESAWIVGQRVPDLFPPDDLEGASRQREELLAGSRPTTTTQCRLVGADGSTRRIEHSIGLARSSTGAPVSYVSTFVDRTQSRLLETRLSYLASHDALTQLANRHDLFSHADGILQHAQRTGTQVCVLYLDVDDLKSINDDHGHAAGDVVLQVVATRLVSACRRNDMVARIGGDEFAILLVGLRALSDAEHVARTIAAAFSVPVDLGGEVVEVGVSIGIAPATRAQGADLALRHADRALYRAKVAGRGRTMTYDEELDG